MKSPWKSFEALVPDREYLVLASLIPPKSIRSTGALFRGSRQVRRQLAMTDGVVGFALLAEPLHKRYATLSVWRDADALAAFTVNQPHRQLMGELAAVMGPTRFERWTITGGAGRPSWADALSRLGLESR